MQRPTIPSRFIMVLLALAIPAGAALAGGPAGSVFITAEKDYLRVNVGGAGGPLFTEYWFGPRDDRPYTRPFFYPVNAPDGSPVTSDQYTEHHKEHPHHQSLWVGQGDVNGANHWALEGDHPPKQRHVRFSKMERDRFVEELEWEGKDHKPILKETRSVVFYVGPEAKLTSRCIDLTLTFTPMAGPVTFGDTKEAGLCSVRVKKEISDHPALTTSTGATGEKNTWGKPADWCDVSGKIKGEDYGVAILDHPSNPRHPSRWHVREYGLLSANIFGLHDFDKKNPPHAGDFTIDPGKPVTFRYLVVIHTGDAKSAKLDEKYKAFAAEK